MHHLPFTIFHFSDLNRLVMISDKDTQTTTAFHKRLSSACLTTVYAEAHHHLTDARQQQTPIIPVFTAQALYPHH